jgi:alkylation response protein AidB-like acyl-CoA dehydrogenase
MGLRGAGLVRVRVETQGLGAASVGVDPDRIRRIASVLGAADLTSIAHGMADQLCKRTIAHATSRVQFPGLFHDEESRDPIGKFGAVKKMVAEMAAARYLIETLDHTLSPVDFSSWSVARAGLVKALTAEALGTAPGSLSYNAGQVFGGTGYSEDDILAKYYRDAAAWRYLGPVNHEVFQGHGEEMLRTWRAGGQRLTGLADEAQLFEEVAQRKALQPELDEVRVHRSRLRGLVSDWQQVYRNYLAPVLKGGGREGEAPAEPLAPGSAGALPSRSLGEDSRLGLAAEVSEHLGRQDAQLLASKALLLRTHARLEQGLPVEIETALVRVWLDRAQGSMDEVENVIKTLLDPAAGRHDRPVVEPSAGPPITRYAEFLATAQPYDSGDFLCRPVDLTQPRYVPEMNEADPDLSGPNQQIRQLLTEHFGPARDGLIYERYIESRHRPDAADLDFCRNHGFFRYPIPRELGGEGRRKVDYYLLTTNAQRLADVAISLTIQANTSIGTTPVFLARDKDLPRAQKELGPFVADMALQQEIQDKLQKLLEHLATGDARRIEKAYRDLHKRLEETVLARGVLKSLAHRFVDCWQQAGRTGLAFDLPAMRVQVQEALAAWKEACAEAPDLHAELGRRREACDLFLRWVARGQISAFALTEPSAGSDTARVATRARLRSVLVEVEPDGVLRFLPDGTGQPRYLLDARRLEFRPDGVFYRWSDQAEPAHINFDQYDYETDDPGRRRYYDHDSRRVHFTDIAQLRERGGRSWYDYYELTGAKMWITNGRMAGIMCLYAKTDQGVTGFIVDRHAEGLVVGKDEDKLGQCGSPTNELSLQAVRVPRENVLGLEGRGQVNALETLNVGRAGLAMSAMAQMRGLIDSSRDFIRGLRIEVRGSRIEIAETEKEILTSGSFDPRSSILDPRIPDWAAWRLQRMEEDRFTAEALAHDVIGRFEHPQTKSVRMESAITKMVVSELLHQVIETAEDIHGLAGQTTAHLVEKRKRDARILNIYEGTNEVQRFSILKDLAAEVAPRWARNPAGAAPNHLGREVLELEALKSTTRQRIDAALELFGQDLWQNPNLQANCFRLAEAAAWLAAAESTLFRLAWLSRQNLADDNAEPSPQVELGRRAFGRCGNEIRQRLRRFEEDLTHLRRGFYAPEIRAAALLFDQVPQTQAATAPASRITRPLGLLVVVEPSAAAVPHPYVVGGRLLEPHLSLNEADRSALEMALRIRDQAAARVMITVAAVGPRGGALLLREALSLGVDRVRLLVIESDAVTPDSAATALAAVLGNEGSFDLILGGILDTGGEEGQVARHTAQALGVAHAGRASALAVQAGPASGVLETSAAGPVVEDAGIALIIGAEQKTLASRPLPAAVSVEPGIALRDFTTSGYLTGLGRAVEMDRWPKKMEAHPVLFLGPASALASAAPEDKPHPLQPREAGPWFLREIGLGAQGSHVLKAYEGPLPDVDEPLFSRQEGALSVLAILSADAAGRLLPSAESTVRAARFVAQVEEDPAGMVVALVVGREEDSQRQALGQLLTWYQGKVVLVPLAGAEKSDEVKGRLLAECLARLPALPAAVLGEPWTEQAFVKLAAPASHPYRPLRAGEGKGGGAGEIVSQVHSLGEDSGQLILQTRRARGKLRVLQARRLKVGKTCWISLAEDLEVAGIAAGKDLRGLECLGKLAVERWTPLLEGFYGRGDMQRLLDELKEETGLVRLADAEFIIDVGFGIGNQDGYEAVIEPLEKALRDLGVHNLRIGGSRKVTEDLHLLPADSQIGQSGVSVNPRILLAIGISGAPQHLNYIGPRAKILAFNRDPEAPLMTLNQRQPQPKVYPVVGDLFDTVPALTAALRQEQPRPQLVRDQAIR